MGNSKKKKPGRILLSILCVILGLILVLLIGATLFVDSFLDRINRFDEDEPTLSHEEVDIILRETDPLDEEYTGEVLDPEDVTVPTAPAEEIETEDHIVNILLIGQDRRPGQGRQRSDAMILCTINTEKKTLVMTSFLRDLYVQLPEYNGNTYYNNRLNVNYVIGGMQMLNDCLKLNFGVDVDHNIEVDFSGFESIVDLMGGVDIELTEGEAWYVGQGARAGMNHLNGAQALTYSRIRAIGTDFGRTNRQRTVLNALLNKAKDLSLSELTDLANEIIPLITTDMTNTEIIKYVMDFFPILSELEVTTQRVPADEHYYSASIAGMSVLVPDYEAVIQMLKDTIG